MATAAPQRFKTNPIPSTELRHRSPIWFLHPGYPESSNRMLSLARVDRTPTGTFGVHHRTALVACQIIANNAFDTGYLTLDQAGEQRVDTPPDGILIEENYYLIVGAGPVRYPVVPSFRDWAFPHSRIPNFWHGAIFTSSTDGKPRCGVTNYSRPVEMAHLVPKEEAEWYDRNNMGRYSVSIYPDIDNPTNILPLRVDIHKLFDARAFVIVPKIAEGEASHYVTHILSNNEAEYWPTHHDVLVQNPPEESQPYLFARFAWAILMRVKYFVVTRPRHVVKLYVTTNEHGDEREEYKTEFLTAKQLMTSYGGGGSKAATPNTGKRTRTTNTIDNDSMESSGGDESLDDVWDLVDDNELPRKRRRQQQSSEETAPATKPSLPLDVEADLKEALRRAMAEQQASQEAQEDNFREDDSEENDSEEDDSREVKMTLPLRPEWGVQRTSTYKPTGKYY